MPWKKLSELHQKYFSSERRVSQETLQQMRNSLLEESALEQNFLILVVGSCIIATLGLLANSVAVIIGAMIIAPLMLPIRSVAFGILEADRRLIRSGLLSVIVGSALPVLISALIGLATSVAQYGSEVLARTQPTLLDLGIALTAGAIAGFAKVEPKISTTLAGTAIAVALMPPICVVGLWVAQGNWRLSLGALLLYMTNLFGITLACMVAFMLGGYSPFHRARRPLGLTLILTSLLMVPLGYSSFTLLRQNRLETSLRQALLNKTVTFQRLRLVSMETDWLRSPPEVLLIVYASEPLTPTQVGLLEEFVGREMGRPFKLIFQVSRLEEVTHELPPAESPTPASPSP
ncbi:DUF389 domain-containing protein [Pseudanabaena sp. FACHB-2040]|uniref:DUF389 domain-containing protein n=1 Tax=Pseudanabaena sp. FACHB-2040 TaxID=2692859 RepID=UPI00168557C5|nr:DUF389 domain-containing protein [Pseudanabaena sp. FACHB-2040]MBD2258987.1 DUF389 domain-containing protein [Pseudanabaena sp. FACHB-2040]